MIATLRGEITQVEDNAVILEAGGIGYRTYMPAPLINHLQVGETILVYTHLVVREDEWKLYGFETRADRDLFLLLLGVDGVGPRTALGLLSKVPPEVIQKAVLGEKPELLEGVPGVGKKTSQKIVLYLQGKFKPEEILKARGYMPDIDSEVLAALTALGYSVIEAQTAIQALPKDAPENVEERLRLALQQFKG